MMEMFLWKYVCAEDAVLKMEKEIDDQEELAEDPRYIELCEERKQLIEKMKPKRIWIH